MKTEILQQHPIEVEVKFPFYRDRLTGEYGLAGFEKKYYKFDNLHKVTVITERMCETTILTYNDKNHNFFRDMVTPEMYEQNHGYSETHPNIWANVVDRLIQKVSDGI